MPHSPAASAVAPSAGVPIDGAPCAPAAPRFAMTPGPTPEALATELLNALDARCDHIAADPFTSPVLLTALELSDRLADGTLSLGDLERLVQYLSQQGFRYRAYRLGRSLGEADLVSNDARLRALFLALAKPRTPEESSNEDAARVPFSLFKYRAERELFGIVLTAHPTFNLSGELMSALTRLATAREADGRPLSAEAEDAILELAAAAEHRPESPMTLDREHALSLLAIGNIQTALRRAYLVLFEVAQSLYPDRWLELAPKLVTVATWVGYDLDGRADIGWTETFAKRLKVQLGQLRLYLADIQAIRDQVARVDRDLCDLLDLLATRVALGVSQVRDEIAAFEAANPESAAGRAGIAEISRRMYEGLPQRLPASGGLVELTDRALTKTRDLAARPEPPADADGLDDVLRRLAVLRAELANFGLGMAHTHVRINATQVHNAIRKLVGLSTGPADPRFRRSYLERLDGLLASVEPVAINFGSVVAESVSVKRLFMVVRQMLRYAGRTAPIRFLIAETETAFTLLAALYFAKQFGIENHLDISPLFETERALEAGSRIIDELLSNAHYRAYVEGRGRLCVQTGYSDAGRFIGQTPANASIERLRRRLVRVLLKHDLGHVQLVIFDTHGESIGRGSHPAGLSERLANINTDETRRLMAAAGVDFKQEMSFQGGDGFLPFVTLPAAYATVTRILEHVLTPPDPVAAPDPFYDDADYVREFLTTVKEFQVELVEDRNYGVLLMAFGTNLLFPSGSRPLKRQHEDPADIDHASARQLRAIPHNAVLQQLGFLANSVGGLGAAIAKDPQRFRSLYRRSSRFRQLMGIVEYGAAISDPMVMKAYIDSLDPGLWIILADRTQDGAAAERHRRLADQLEDARLHERQARVFRRLYRDFTILRRTIDQMVADGEGGACAVADAETVAHLRLLHAVRIALIQRIFTTAMQVPTFSGRHGTTPEILSQRLLHLDVDLAVDQLARIFPAVEEPTEVLDFGEPADPVEAADAGYGAENREIFQPLLGLMTLIRRISTATTHRIGFLG